MLWQVSRGPSAITAPPAQSFESFSQPGGQQGKHVAGDVPMDR
jgi:hypothetical protein